MDKYQIRRALGVLAIMSMLIHLVIVFMGAAVDPYPIFSDETTPDYTVCCAGFLLIAVFVLSGVNAVDMIFPLHQSIGKWVSLLLIAIFILFGVAYFISNKSTLPMNINTLLFVIYGGVAPTTAYFTSEDT